MDRDLDLGSIFSSTRLALCQNPPRCKSQEGDKMTPCPAGIIRVNNVFSGDSCLGIEEATIR